MSAETSNLIQALAAVFVALTALAGVVLAWRGLKTWRDELRGRSEYELARQILTGVYNVRDAVAWLRNAGISDAEWSDRPGYDPGQSGNPDDLAFAYGKRWRTVWEARRRLDADLLAAEALWDGALGQPVAALDGHLRELFFHIFRRHLRALRDERYREAIQKDWEKTEQLIWSDIDPEKGDQFGDEFAATVGHFDAALKPHLRR